MDDLIESTLSAYEAAIVRLEFVLKHMIMEKSRYKGEEKSLIVIREFLSKIRRVQIIRGANVPGIGILLITFWYAKVSIGKHRSHTRPVPRPLP